MAATFDDYGNPLTNDDGSNWQPSDTPPVVVDDGPPPVSTTDSIYGGELYDSITKMLDEWSGVPEVGESSGEGKGIIDTGGSWISKIRDAARDFFGFDTDPTNKDPNKNYFPKLLATGAALAIGGAGKAYTDSKRLAQEKEIADKKLLIESQNAGILQQKMANQNFSNVSFKAPPNGLINTFKPAKITSLKDRIKT